MLVTEIRTKREKPLVVKRRPAKWSEAVANKTKTLIEYSSILLLHSRFNKEKTNPISPTSALMNNNIITTLYMKSERLSHHSLDWDGAAPTVATGERM